MATTTDATIEQLDVLIVGAGISGIGAAHHLQRAHPQRSYAVLEMREATGGTWDLFRYPGIRSDSDLHTYGYAFKPWRSENAIAGGDEIVSYIRETARESGIDRHIRTGHRVLSAAWSTDEARWTVTVRRTDTGATERIACGWLFCASGYFDYERGYAPELPGAERFAGQIIHPQHWPADLDYAGRRVVVIGSGATAVTLAPAMAPTAAHVTMLQRSPSYIVALPARDPIANALTRRLGARRAYAITRFKNIRLQKLTYQFCQRFPRLARRVLRRITERQLPAGYPIATHFTPRYDPWDQRLCVVPDGDLFAAIRAGRASIVTDQVQSLVPEGIRLASGETLPADIIVTATGLNLLAFGGIEFTVDGAPMAVADRIAYRGTMLSGLPNLSYAIGYTNASWTLKVDLVCEYLCRLLRHMDAHRYDVCVPTLPAEPMETRPLLDFSAGYVLRSLDALPRQGDRAPWNLPMSYPVDVRQLRHGPIADPNLRFTRSAAAERSHPVTEVAAAGYEGP